MVKIKVINRYDAPIVLKEGQSGNFRDKATIQPGRNYDIDFLPDATYREYMCVVSTNNSMIVSLSSDDLSDIPAEIEIKKDANGKLAFELKKKNGFSLATSFAHVTSDAKIERGTATIGNLFSKAGKGVVSWLSRKV
ncbi:hypothetical protein M758_4G239400 [Ceratodon purpureus]|nr:hypothetical protein M758_4G239400 [Ceratodon purpureus]